MPASRTTWRKSTADISDDACNDNANDTVDANDIVDTNDTVDACTDYTKETALTVSIPAYILL